MAINCNGVFEGGGVRGIGHVGAACGLEQAGYRFVHLAGSSAGAIVASLLACGYTAPQLRLLLEGLDYLRFRQEGLLSRMGTMGKAVSLYTQLGVYDADYFEQWLSELLGKKGFTTFGRLRTRPGDPERWKLQITASDVTDHRLLILPQDFALFGLDPDQCRIARAVRMSMSIPLFYKPCHLRGADGRDHLIVDGGLLSNYPVWLFDNPQLPVGLPTLGFKFVDDKPSGYCDRQGGCKISFWDYLKLLTATALDGADKQHISEGGGDFARTVAISATVEEQGERHKISATDFGLTPEQSRQLFQNGLTAAEHFLTTWSFFDWQRQYRA
ncbi:MAG: patatin-like phospholipase family protein [Angelakisella sp.]